MFYLHKIFLMHRLDISAKGLYFEIVIVWSVTESIIHPEPFPKDFCMFVIVAV